MGFWKGVKTSKVELNEWGVLKELDVQDKDIFRCGFWGCSSFAFQHGAFVPSGLRPSDNAMEVQRWLRDGRSRFHLQKWCLNCCQKLSK